MARPWRRTVTAEQGRRVGLRFFGALWALSIVLGLLLAGPVGGIGLGLVGVGGVGAWAARRSTGTTSGRPAQDRRRPGPLERLRERIDPPSAGAPGDWIVVADVGFSEGPLVHSAIEGAGIRAVRRDTSVLPAHGLDRCQVAVQRRDVEAAREIVEQLGRR